MKFSYEHPKFGTVNVTASMQVLGYSKVKFLDVIALGEKGKLFTSLDLPVESTKEFIIQKINQYIKEN